MLGWATLPPMDGFSVLSSILRPQGRLRRQQSERSFRWPRLMPWLAPPRPNSMRAKRVQMLKDAFKIAHDQAFYMPLHQQPVAWAMSDKVDIPQFPDEYVRPWFAQMK